MLRIQNSLQIMTAVAVLALSSCTPPEPLRIGYLGGLSGRVADLGIGGLNGAHLAVSQRNQAGGIKGRQIELIEEDDQQNPDLARQAAGRLIDHKVMAIIGPMTSAMAVAVLPLINTAEIAMISPTVTTNELAGLDDYFFRIIPATREFVKTSAGYNARTLGLHRIRPVFDLRNRAYTESWLNDFVQSFSATGGKILTPLSFTSSDDINFATLARDALAGNPDGIILISNSVDAAMLCQSLRRLNPTIAIGTTEWAATERLVELGGKSVEGITVPQLFQRQSSQPAYLSFRKAYVERFGQEPGFAGLLAFDASNVALDALEKKAQGQSLKQAILSLKTFAGTQRSITFDAYGDTEGGTFMVTIKDGAFVPILPSP